VADPVLKHGGDGVNILTPGRSNRVLYDMPIDAGYFREIHGDMLHCVPDVVLPGLSQLPDGFTVIQLPFQVQEQLNVVFGKESIAVRPPFEDGADDSVLPISG
jgi:hypothetical protein